MDSIQYGPIGVRLVLMYAVFLIGFFCYSFTMSERNAPDTPHVNASLLAQREMGRGDVNGPLGWAIKNVLGMNAEIWLAAHREDKGVLALNQEEENGLRRSLHNVPGDFEAAERQGYAEAYVRKGGKFEDDLNPGNLMKQSKHLLTAEDFRHPAGGETYGDVIHHIANIENALFDRELKNLTVDSVLPLPLNEYQALAGKAKEKVQKIVHSVGVNYVRGCLLPGKAGEFFRNKALEPLQDLTLPEGEPRREMTDEFVFETEKLAGILHMLPVELLPASSIIEMRKTTLRSPLYQALKLEENSNHFGHADQEIYRMNYENGERVMVSRERFGDNPQAYLHHMDVLARPYVTRYWRYDGNEVVKREYFNNVLTAEDTTVINENDWNDFLHKEQERLGKVVEEKQVVKYKDDIE